MNNFIVETGSGLSNANSFITVAFAKEYWLARGRSVVTPTPYTDTVIQEALVRGTQYISESHRWKGFRRRQRHSTEGFQALEWPREDVLDREGNWVPSYEVPREVKQATAEAGWYELQNPHGLQPSYISHGRIKSQMVGNLKIEYDVSRKDASGARPVLLIIRDLIGEFLNPAYSNRLSGRAVRG